MRLWLKSAKRFQPVLMFVPLRLNFKRSQQRSPRMAAEVPILLRSRGKKPRRILRLPVPREQQKRRHQPSAGPKNRKDRKTLGKHSIVLRLWPWKLRRLYPQSGGIPPPPVPRGTPPPLWSALSPSKSQSASKPCPPSRGAETSRSSAFLAASLPLHPWDYRRDGRGRLLLEFMAENDLINLNSGEKIFLYSVYHSTSAIDLAVASPSIASECSWAAHSDLCGSDHFPIFLIFCSNFNGIRGNENVDKLAKAALNRDSGGPHMAHPELSFKRNEEQPFCYACDSLHNVRHILIECPDFQGTRRKYFSVTDMYRLIREVNPSHIVEYLKELDVYRNI
ncbi:hypothetical protein PoB_002853500 [Plakobranchus ocellatus]|uniref:Endonuclease/exonuclease/phosphatase domain-containing protein n=1 Tax=Plakobranchus ocellatus TaxID=259542 RepID=A0AAV4A3T0_9GAST|nr:hypothetical protein PoB_002853500 [Plakobranchus ocellatus]